MNPEKVGKFIKDLRKKNNLTQAEFAQKYHVTYQAVSKWENGINLPDVSLIRQMSKDFNVSVEDILDGEENIKNEPNKLLIVFIILIIILTFISILIISLKKIEKDKTFNFKTIKATCEEFNVSGSIAYDKEKSSIYISHINYCGRDDNITYEEIECNLYEKNGETTNKISSCKSTNNTKLEDYLEEVKLNIDNYSQKCKEYNNDSLYLEINAKDNNQTYTYEIPLELNENCK